MTESTIIEAPTTTPTDRLAQQVTDDQLEAMTRTLTLPEAMRLGATVTTQAHGWGSGDTACALSAARIGATVAGYIKR